MGLGGFLVACCSDLVKYLCARWQKKYPPRPILKKGEDVEKLSNPGTFLAALLPVLTAGFPCAGSPTSCLLNVIFELVLLSLSLHQKKCRHARVEHKAPFASWGGQKSFQQRCSSGD